MLTYNISCYKMLMDLFLLLNSLFISLSVISLIGLKYIVRLNAHTLTSALFVFFVVCTAISQVVQNSFFFSFDQFFNSVVCNGILLVTQV